MVITKQIFQLTGTSASVLSDELNYFAKFHKRAGGTIHEMTLAYGGVNEMFGYSYYIGTVVYSSVRTEKDYYQHRLENQELINEEQNQFQKLEEEFHSLLNKTSGIEIY